MSSYGMSCYVMLCYVMICHAVSCYVSCYAYVMLCYVMLCHVMACYVMLGHVCQFGFILLSFINRCLESRCTWFRSEHCNTKTPRCIYKDSRQPVQGPVRSSTAWTNANEFVGSKSVIPNADGPGMSIPQ